jgi:hypothetical protein
MDVRTQSGDVFVLDENKILIYGSHGIELCLNQRNLDVAREARKTMACLKDQDTKDVRFTVGYLESNESFRFEPTKGERIEVKAWLLVDKV